MTIAAGIIFSVVALVFRMFPLAHVAVLGAIGFVIGGGARAVLNVGLLVLRIGEHTKLTRVEGLGTWQPSRLVLLWAGGAFVLYSPEIFFMLMELGDYKVRQVDSI